ncbi:MAG: di-trans,poly-cis-decaprenylcistransferase [Methanomicrobium sp.]|nr:di-trans,poly-cis-decaprenylcistransferase [Methanomicrobium sp.]MBR6497263.1 di-trans,poly-cis-decaprenylcistransferase [Methanomicrobium sp.]
MIGLKDIADRVYEKKLASQIEYIPKHIAIIQDGNRRYAKEKGIDVALGHRLGAEKTMEVLEWARDIGVKEITLYCFSTENFNRSEGELKDLFSLFMDKANEVLGKLNREVAPENRIRIRMVGDRSLLPQDFLSKIEKVEEMTKDFHNYTINLAIAYGGRNEILCAARSILKKVYSGELDADAIDVDTVDDNIYNDISISPVDLIIRTGNEKRTSNFLPWSANGNRSAVYFCAPYWPMFRKIDLLRGIRVYDQRVRELKQSKTRNAQ